MEASKKDNISGCVSDSVDCCGCFCNDGDDQSAVIGIAGMACHFPG